MTKEQRAHAAKLGVNPYMRTVIFPTPAEKHFLTVLHQLTFGGLATDGRTFLSQQFLRSELDRAVMQALTVASGNVLLKKISEGLCIRNNLSRCIALGFLDHKPVGRALAGFYSLTEKALAHIEFMKSTGEYNEPRSPQWSPTPLQQLALKAIVEYCNSLQSYCDIADVVFERFGFTRSLYFKKYGVNFDTLKGLRAKGLLYADESNPRYFTYQVTSDGLNTYLFVKKMLGNYGNSNR